MASNVKFNRQAKVTINNGKVIDGLRISFRVERVAGDAYAKLKLDIFNLVLRKENEVGNILNKGDVITLEAGYEDNVSVLFLGTITNIVITKVQIDTITTVYCSDNRNESRPLINSSYRNQSSLVSVISDIAFEANIDIAEISIDSQNIKGNLTYSKPFDEIMNSLANTYDFTWYVYNFELYLYQNRTANINKQVLLINASTGLLDTPILTQKGIDIKMLLEPSVKWKDIYEVQSGGLQLAQGNLEINDRITAGEGRQSVLSVIHTGDTHSNTWFTEIEGEAI